MRHRIGTALLAAALLFLGGCGGGNGTAAGTPEETPETLEILDDEIPLAAFPQEEGYKAPPLLDSAYHEAEAEGSEDAKIDLSAVSDGYVAVAAASESRLKFQVLKDDATYNYDIASDGTPSVFPLQSGDGDYRFRIMENVGESKYAEKYSAVCTVTLADEFQPFLRPNAYVNYDESSECVRKAAELTAGEFERFIKEGV